MSTQFAHTSTPAAGAVVRPSDGPARHLHAIDAITAVIRNDRSLASHAGRIRVTVEEQSVVLRGELPEERLKSRLIDAVRQAGVMWRVRNEVAVAE